MTESRPEHDRQPAADATLADHLVISPSAVIRLAGTWQTGPYVPSMKACAGFNSGFRIVDAASARPSDAGL